MLTFKEFKNQITEQKTKIKTLDEVSNETAIAESKKVAKQYKNLFARLADA